jgi:hypothetical protein
MGAMTATINAAAGVASTLSRLSDRCHRRLPVPPCPSPYFFLPRTEQNSLELKQLGRLINWLDVEGVTCELLGALM